jgi:hypothetical protein
MATIVLTAVGFAIGGPIGAAIGSAIGQGIDAHVLKPKGRQGPRLGDLSVQTSAYGTQIPKVFGRMRVAGSVIWATDLEEHRKKSGGGKGRPSTTTYNYSASFAVALSARPLLSVGRIWADGKLLRGAGGDFKSDVGAFRLHRGSEDQAADPLIAAAEGAGQTSAFRGIAYAVFEDLQLADFGNRIPLLTFEVTADPGPVAAGTIAETLSCGTIVGGETPAFVGYAASGDSVRGAVEALGEGVPLCFAPEGGRLVMLPAIAAPLPVLAVGDRGTRTAGAGGVFERFRQPSGAVPSEVSLAYYDPARDYQAGLQRAATGRVSPRAERLSIAAAIDAAGAKALAEHRLAAAEAGRLRVRAHLPPRLSAWRPGRHLRLEDEPGLWRVERWTLERAIVSIELTRVPAGALGGAAAGPGRNVGETDLPHGPTRLILSDLPLGGERLPTRPYLFALATGESEGWRRAALSGSFDGGASWEDAGATAAPAVAGAAFEALPAAGSALFDEAGSVEIELLHDAMWLESRSDAALAGGANLALLGDELIQFGVAAQTGPRRFRLSRLLRGRRGTEWAAGAHVAGERFALVQPEALATIEAPAAALGTTARLIGLGVGDAPEGVEAQASVTGEALRPPSPVHLRAERLAGGDLAIRWVRRSRSGWLWSDGGDAPLGEETERYRLRLQGEGFVREVETEVPSWTYLAAAQAADGAAAFDIQVAQLGTFAASRPARISVS